MNRCTIREWKTEDKDDLAHNLNNKKILDQLRDGLPYPYTPEDAKDYIELMIHSNRETTYPFAITLNDKVIGSIGVFRCDNIHSHSAEIGYYIGEPYWGQGYMTDVLQQVCQYIFNNTDIIRLFAQPFASNIASCRVLEKAGFTCEGLMKHHAIKNGIIKDMKLYALLKEI